MERFIKRQNIAHYQALLKNGGLNEEQRQMILRLLAEEEMHQTESNELPEPPGGKPVGATG